MSDFELYFKLGFHHVLDPSGYDHILFLLALSLPYLLKDWRKVLLLVTLFTIGHTMSLVLAVFGIVDFKPQIIELLIPITILATAVFNIVTKRKKNYKEGESVSFIAVTTLFFGLIHGLGFFNFFKIQLAASNESALLPLAEFAFGIETAQIVVVLAALILSGVVQSVFRVQKRDWILIVSSFIIGVVVPMIIHSEIW